jgi:hypothetical protein
MQKPAFACGSMVLSFFAGYFSPRVCSELQFKARFVTAQASAS